MMPIINPATSIYLSTLIEYFMATCRDKFPDITFTIKFHHLVHYCSKILEYGPLKFVSTINFESKHSFLKNLCSLSKNWKRPDLTIAKKYSRFSCLDVPENSENFKISLNAYKLPNQLTNSMNLAVNDMIFEYNVFSYKSCKYRKGSIILHSQTEHCIIFLKILNIFEINQNIIFYGELYKSFLDEDLNIYILYNLNDRAYRFFESMLNHDYSCFNVYKEEDCEFFFPTHSFLEF